MRRQLPLDFWDGWARPALWESLPRPDRRRVVELYTRLALRTARGDEAAEVDARVGACEEDENDGSKHEERRNGQPAEG